MQNVLRIFFYFLDDFHVSKDGQLKNDWPLHDIWPAVGTPGKSAGT